MVKYVDFKMDIFNTLTKTYNTNFPVTLLTKYLMTQQEGYHWMQNTMTTPWYKKNQNNLHTDN